MFLRAQNRKNPSGAIAVKNDEDKYEPVRSDGEQPLALKPDTNEYLPVNDLREEMKRASEEYPPTKEAKQAFYQQRIKLIESADIPDDHKDDLLEPLKLSAQEEESDAGPEYPPDPRPIPGGVGYGAFYKDGALEFSNSSALYYYIVTIPNIGDATNQWLYLTSTNRSPKGVEALVSYHQQDNPMFMVFDWSKTGNARWSLSRPYSQLSDYLTPYTAEGHQYQTIYVANSTRRIAGTRWINEVMLYNRNTNAYDLVYSNEYDLAATDEQKYLWWGPIVETFPPFPTQTNDIGFFEARLLQDGAAPSLLTSDLTDLKIDNPGFQVVFDRPNYSFVVH
jgi:hypothetical protein